MSMDTIDIYGTLLQRIYEVLSVNRNLVVDKVSFLRCVTCIILGATLYAGFKPYIKSEIMNRLFIILAGN